MLKSIECSANYWIVHQIWILEVKQIFLEGKTELSTIA